VKTPKITQKHDKKGEFKRIFGLFCREKWCFEPEFRFDKDRRWRFDWANPELKLAIEVEGVTYFGKAIGRHQSANGIEGDMEKYNRAIELGWVVLRYSQRMISNEPDKIVRQVLSVMEILRGRAN